MIQTRTFGTFSISVRRNHCSRLNGFGQKRFAVAALLRWSYSLLVKLYCIVVPTNRNTLFYTIKADRNKKRKQSFSASADATVT